MSFSPRLNDTGLDTLAYYTSENPFYPQTIDIGNCTWYSWGRFFEEGEPPTRPALSLSDANDWYSYNDGYERGQTPKLGAVICFRGGNFSGLGHVAVVEEIHSDGSLTVSESGYAGYYFRTNTRRPGGTYPYSNAEEGYIFQGFIYNPYVNTAPPEPANWITGNRYLDRSEMDNNAIKFYYTMTRLGASYNAILGMLANIQDESTINPGIWEGLEPYGGGYGLVQWTPYTKYSEWAGTSWENNGQKECERIKYEADNGLQWFSNPAAPDHGYPVDPPITFSNFFTSSLEPKVLADYWLLYYEHPGEQYIADRIAGHQARVDYYNQLLGGGGPVPALKAKIWLYFAAMRKRRAINDTSILRIFKYI